jgi:hypothetical protein
MADTIRLEKHRLTIPPTLTPRRSFEGRYFL